MHFLFHSRLIWVGILIMLIVLGTMALPPLSGEDGHSQPPGGLPTQSTSAALPVHSATPTRLPPTATTAPLPTIAPTATAEPLITVEPLALVTPTLPVGEKRIVIDLSAQSLVSYQGGVVVFHFVISSGKNDATARGKFKILDKIPMANSVPLGFRMPYWMGLYWTENDIENGIHALPVLSDGSQIWGDQLGRPVSTGCIVLNTDDAQKLFEWAEIGTLVEIQE